MTATIEEKRITGEIAPVTLMRKEFNVLCVTKRRSEQQLDKFRKAERHCSIEWHQPITGRLVVEVTGVQMGDLVIPAETKVEFNGLPCRFRYFSTGLSGTVFVVGAENPEDSHRFDTWHFYTDELTDKGKELGRADVPAPTRTPDVEGRIYGGSEAPVCSVCGQ